tara:strand:+ start:248 stop:433 length:186 start_codon:yes stop_codon:yes gene_type:complete
LVQEGINKSQKIDRDGLRVRIRIGAKTGIGESEKRILQSDAHTNDITTTPTEHQQQPPQQD